MFLWYIYKYSKSSTKDSLISETTSLLIPFALFLIPGIFRIPALKTEKQNQKFMYNFSMFLENWLG